MTNDSLFDTSLKQNSKISVFHSPKAFLTIQQIYSQQTPHSTPPLNTPALPFMVWHFPIPPVYFFPSPSFSSNTTIMHLAAVLSLSAISTISQEPSQPETAVSQYKLLLQTTGIAKMHHTTEAIALHEAQLIPAKQTDTHTDCCAWRGIACADGAVTAVEWSIIHKPEVVSLDWFPPTVRCLHLFNRADIGGEVSTAKLPRELREVNLTSCNLVGTLNLGALPRKLEVGRFSHNAFDVPIVVDGLPETLRKLDIWGYKPKKVYVVNAAIPKDLEYIWYGWVYYKIKAVCVDASKVDPRVCTPSQEAQQVASEEGVVAMGYLSSESEDSEPRASSDEYNALMQEHFGFNYGNAGAEAQE